jgi:D-3-phosphoglycerate dehydrogenase
LAALVPGCDGLIAGLDDIDRRVLDAADRLRVIARYGVGLDRVDMEAARKRGIVVTNTPGANAGAVAELTIGLMLSLARSIPETTSATRAGGWPRLTGLALEGKTIGLLGFGTIGKEVARRISSFDSHVIAFDPKPDQSSADKYGVTLTSQDEVVRQSDFLSLHLPAMPETMGMVDSEFLERMKPGSFLINTARGELVDEPTLFAALKRGHLRGAAIDSWRKEPPGADNPLLSLPQVIAMPHTGSHTDVAANAMGRMALRNCLAVLSGNKPAFVVG